MSLLAVFVLASLGAEPAEDPRAEPREESIGSLLSGETEKADGRDASAQGLLFRMLGWTAALGVAALAAVRIWKKVGGAGRLPAGDAGSLRVIGRTALTPRHFLYAVRVGNQRLLVVGVSGDRISALTEFDDPAQVVALDPSFQTALEGEAGDGNGGERGEGGLSGYRAEVNRLRQMVRGWRGRIARTKSDRPESGIIARGRSEVPV
jgi:flagellar biogenesis protein FliO